MELFATIVVIIFAIIIVIYFHIKRWSKKISINLNRDSDINKFLELLFVYDQKTAYLNIILSPKQIEEFKNNHSFSLTKVYHKGTISGDFCIVFDKQFNEKLPKKIFVHPNQLKGYFKIEHKEKPQKGCYTIILRLQS